ncbi:tRNA uracil 4-sulfurtransferase ThiI [Spiroplasma endosymbiont of Crioceris asparagi]|uniref:tRNA uracil 4-sulfurtransferase ThiI n=1 Tax=Spiroplasma endosymbiont of Crioceris asparagi TaxID=3066286 RepID=UPI0030CA9474
MKTILIRYGELTLKGNNRDIFIDQLIKNIKFKLKPYKESLTYIKDHNSLELEMIDESKIEVICNIVKNIFGIYSYSIAEKISYSNTEKIIDTVVESAKIIKNRTFKVNVVRKDKTFPIKSDEFKLDLAKNILQKYDNLKVDVKNPEVEIQVLIKQKKAYVFSEKHDCVKGLPVGTGGKAISLISGGIDSPVASFLSLKRGLQVDFLHFMTPPHTTKEAVDKVFDLIKAIAKYNTNNSSFYLCDFSTILKELMHIKDESYRITIMRRVFLIIANKLSEKIGASAIITGDSLGQVASQTIESMSVISEVSEKIILRPLITFDKEEIIKIAKQINTYETSILPFDDVCSMYVPKKPVIKPKLKQALIQEEGLIIEEMVEYVINNCITRYYLKDGEWNEEKKI